MKNKEFIYLGEKVVLSDPCYVLDGSDNIILENMKGGKYFCNKKRKDGSIKEISVVHDDYKNDNLMCEQVAINVGIDSGTAGIFDYEYYKKFHTNKNGKDCLNDSWFKNINDLTYIEAENDRYVLFENMVYSKVFLTELKDEFDLLKNNYSKESSPKCTEEFIDEIFNFFIKLFDEDSEFSSRLGIFDKLNFLIKENEYEENLFIIGTKYFDKFNLLKKGYYHSLESKKTVYKKVAAVVDEKGYCSCSPYGDGGAKCFVSKNKEKQIIAIKIVF